MPQIFGLFLKNKFVAKFFQREPNLVTLQVQSIMLDSRLRELECSLPRHKVPCVTTLVTTLLGVPIFTSYQ